MNGTNNSTHGWEFDMTIKITYDANGPVSTQQMLNLAYRLFNETPGSLVVRLDRIAQSTVVSIVLLRSASNGPISESINVIETGG